MSPYCRDARNISRLFDIPYYNLAKVGLTLVRIFLPRRPICLNYGEFAFFGLSCWFGCLSFALAPIRLLPHYTVGIAFIFTLGWWRVRVRFRDYVSPAGSWVLGVENAVEC